MWYEEVAEEQRCKLAVAVVVVVVVVVVIAPASRSTYTGRPRVPSDDVPTSTRGITNHNNAMITLAFIRVVMIIPELPRVTLDLFKSGYFLYP